MERYGEYHDGKNSTIVKLYPRLSLELLEHRMQRILRDIGAYSPDEIILHVDIGPFPGTVIYGVIRTHRGHIFELHVLDHPIALRAALFGANGENRLTTHTISESLN